VSEAENRSVVGAEPEVSGQLCISAIEQSLFGVVDVKTFLDTALSITGHEVDPRVLVEPDGTDDLRFPMQDMPPGMEAEFRICRNTEGLPLVLALSMHLEAPRSPYLVDSAIRASPSVRLQVWLEDSGAVRDFVVHTNLEVSPWETGEVLGAKWDEGKMTEGLLYHIKTEDPSAHRITAHGIIDGQPDDWPISGSVETGLDMANVDLFGIRLLAMYRSVNPLQSERR